MVLSSCKKTDTATLAASFTNSMSATINGTAWSAGAATGYTTSGLLFLSGVNTNQSSISMQVPANIVAGTYTVSTTSATYIIGYTNGTITYTMSDGTLIVSSNANNTISGTFTGTLMDLVSMATIPVTNGTFAVKYQ